MQRYTIGDYYCPLCDTVYPDTRDHENAFVYRDDIAGQLCCGVCGRVLQVVTNVIGRAIEVAELDEIARAAPAA
jgi:hypothetical protein